MKPILYIVIPCYNEEEVLPITCKEFLAKIEELVHKDKISEIDKNFAVQSTNDMEDTIYINANDSRFEINGVFYEDERYRRLPEADSGRNQR